MNRSFLLFLILFFAKGSDFIATKLISNNVAKLVGNYLDQSDVSKMKKTHKNWGQIEVYENLFPGKSSVYLFRHLETDKFRFTDPSKLIPRKKEIMDILHREGDAKWKGVCEWLFRHTVNKRYLYPKYSTEFFEKMMLVAAENVDVKIQINGVTPLIVAAGISANAVAKLLERGAEVDAIDSRYKATALHHAANASCKENDLICEVLLKFGADVHAKDLFGATALHQVGELYGSGFKAAKVLLEHGANVNAQDDNGDTPLMLLVAGDEYQADNGEILKLFLYWNADIGLMNKEGKTVLDIVEDEERKRDLVLSMRGIIENYYL